eukprot:Hpha_TRINITY_DN15718_c4_g3::TRINITY_DN15718_c4_g3_i22::g.41514::m.41514
MLEEESAKKDKEHWDYVVLTRDQHWDRSNAYKGEIEALKHEVDGYKQTMMMMQQQVQPQLPYQPPYQPPPAPYQPPPGLGGFSMGQPSPSPRGRGRGRQ